MRRIGIVLAAAGCLTATAAVWADSTKTLDDKKAVNGRVVRMSRFEVEIETNRGVTKTLAINNIEPIHFEGESSSMINIRTSLAAGDFEEADKLLASVKADREERPEILADIEFYKALSAGRQALGGNGSIIEAGKSLIAFMSKNPDNYHYLEACELVADLLVAKGVYSRAETYYQELAKAPYAEYRMRAGVGIGRARLAQGKTVEAQQTFEDVLNDESDQGEAERRFAKLGKARCLTASGKTDDAVRLAQGVIDRADPEDNRLCGEAYNTLGAALRAAAAREPEGKLKDSLLNRALLAYLHVDVLYNEAPNAHAEALANLVELFTQLHKSDHAGTCKQTLLGRYPDSRWAERVKKM
jgi:hypothetical protein